jgi:hypothetical protein
MTDTLEQLMQGLESRGDRHGEGAPDYCPPVLAMKRQLRDCRAASADGDGCTSGAGKRLVVAWLARWSARQDIDVVPFKAQNFRMTPALRASWHAFIVAESACSGMAWFCAHHRPKVSRSARYAERVFGED